MAKTQLPYKASPWQHEEIEKIQEDYEIDKSCVVDYLLNKGLANFDKKEFRKVVEWRNKGRKADARTS